MIHSIRFISSCDVPLVGLQPFEVLIFALSDEKGGFGSHGVFVSYRYWHLMIDQHFQCFLNDGWTESNLPISDERARGERANKEQSFFSCYY
jgi:hypothetical protein